MVCYGMNYVWTPSSIFLSRHSLRAAYMVGAAGPSVPMDLVQESGTIVVVHGLVSAAQCAAGQCRKAFSSLPFDATRDLPSGSIARQFPPCLSMSQGIAPPSLQYLSNHHTREQNPLQAVVGGAAL